MNHIRLSKEEKLLIKIEYVYSREGFCHNNYKLKERVRLEVTKIRIGCKAMMTIRNDAKNELCSSLYSSIIMSLLHLEVYICLLRGHR